jgi:ABC-type transport system involved in cytochrome c biogenesis permease subunit
MQRPALAAVRETSAEIGVRFAVIGFAGVVLYAVIQVAYWAAEWVRAYR